MGPKFDPYLNFQADGSLDVCGPTNFGAQDVMFRLIRVRVKDQANTQVEQTFNPPPAIFGSGQTMWEADVPPAKAQTLVTEGRPVIATFTEDVPNGARLK